MTAFVAKAAERRLTTGVVYVPGQVDAHGDYAPRTELSKAFADYALRADKTLRLQHRPGTTAGEVLAVIEWPHPITKSRLCLPDGCAVKSLPAGTILGVARWTPHAWDEVKNGRIRGFSFGGTGTRIRGVPVTKERPDVRRPRRAAETKKPLPKPDRELRCKHGLLPGDCERCKKRPVRKGNLIDLALKHRYVQLT